MTLASVEQMVGMAPAAAQTAVLPAVREKPGLPGLRKAAVFIAQLSKEEAGALLAKMRPREVELLTRELMKLGAVEPDDVDGVLEEFHHLMTAQRFRNLPVVTDGALVGIVSIGDVVKHHVAEVEMEATAMREYITHS